MAKWLAKPAAIITIGCDGNRLASAPPTIAWVLRIVSNPSSPQLTPLPSDGLISTKASAIFVRIDHVDKLLGLFVGRGGHVARSLWIGKYHAGAHGASIFTLDKSPSERGLLSTTPLLRQVLSVRSLRSTDVCLIACQVRRCIIALQVCSGRSNRVASAL
jgi:hypothetical protein